MGVGSENAKNNDHCIGLQPRERGNQLARVHHPPGMYVHERNRRDARGQTRPPPPRVGGPLDRRGQTERGLEVKPVEELTDKEKILIAVWAGCEMRREYANNVLTLTAVIPVSVRIIDGRYVVAEMRGGK